MPNAVHYLPSLSFNSDAVYTLRNRYIEKNNGSVLGVLCRRSPRYEEGCRVASAVCKRNRRTRAHFEKWIEEQCREGSITRHNYTGTTSVKERV